MPSVKNRSVSCQQTGVRERVKEAAVYLNITHSTFRILHHRHRTLLVTDAVVLLSYAVIACTLEGCITSPLTNITTLEAPPPTVEAPTLQSVTSTGITVSWSRPATRHGEVTEYVLQLDSEEIYRGSERSVALSDLQPHTSYQLLLSACTSGGCTASSAVSTVTQEAPPTGLSAPVLKVVFAQTHWLSGSWNQHWAKFLTDGATME